MTKIRSVILSGGSGTRLWPMSRPEKPKQLLALTSAHTMLQMTAQRTIGDAFLPPIVVANAAHADQVEAQLNEAGAAAGAIILEPSGRNTAPAIALAALEADPSEALLVMPSDHVILDVPAFHAAIAAAMQVVDKGGLVTFGIQPDAPETGYGYIQIGEEAALGVYRVERFVEKPDQATAESMLAEGGYAWNGGIFLFRADAYLSALEKFAPEMLEACRAAVAEARREGIRVYPQADRFMACPSDSIDYAVMEKADNVAVVPVAMGWSDVGSWDALHAISACDAEGNVAHGDVIAIDTSNCQFRADQGKKIAAIGVSDLTIVASGDDILILPRGRSQDVKKLIEAMKR
ncbi:mannose-1-phosphate guanylyltransferase/mannose-6-phosphate isomerase [Sphingosinithalassobacter portus]|uniref:mannose-1-phosphate guanylyltransferase/mannose-6-phosphate isomerase n=1 Tax=Stakelama portus TaxID=2676234 RepID=UPI000D6E4D43|nr:mannose-1-phosphate guanylyltransferase/mannose-6-phosphate isomerase [Sphingosinithalassobacter portus]